MKDKSVVHKDCFAYNGNYKVKGCTILKELYCAKEECKFYKTAIDGRYLWQTEKNCN